MDFRNRIHREREFAGFTKLDGTVLFYNFVKSVIYNISAARVLDFGAGRGALLQTEIPWMREVIDLRQSGAEVWAADIDPIVGQHPASQHQVVLEDGAPLPFDDDFFDTIVSDWTFEHVSRPAETAVELLRVLKPNGYICVRTANRYGYIKAAAQLVPNRLHVRALRSVQPDRLEKDVFPTVYKMNSVRDIRALFPNTTVSWYRDSADPAYYFGKSWLYRLFLLLHKLMPQQFATTVCFFIRKAV